MISGLRLADIKKLPTYRPEIALTYVYLFCGELPKIFLMIRLQTTVPFPPLPGLDMGVGERFIILSGQVSASTFTCHPRPSTYDISSFPSLEISSRRMYSIPRSGRKVFLARSTISSNKLPAHLQLYFQSYESLNVAVIPQKATPSSMLLSARRNQGSIVLYAPV